MECIAERLYLRAIQLHHNQANVVPYNRKREQTKQTKGQSSTMLLDIERTPDSDLLQILLYYGPTLYRSTIDCTLGNTIVIHQTGNSPMTPCPMSLLLR